MWKGRKCGENEQEAGIRAANSCHVISWYPVAAFWLRSFIRSQSAFGEQTSAVFQKWLLTVDMVARRSAMVKQWCQSDPRWTALSIHRHYSHQTVYWSRLSFSALILTGFEFPHCSHPAWSIQMQFRSPLVNESFGEASFTSSVKNAQTRALIMQVFENSGSWNFCLFLSLS